MNVVRHEKRRVGEVGGSQREGAKHEGFSDHLDHDLDSSVLPFMVRNVLSRIH